MLYASQLPSCYNQRSMETNNTSNKKQLWVGIAVSFISLVLIFVFIKPAEIINALQQANFFYLALGSAAVLLFFIFRAVRWRFLLRNQVPYWSVFHIQNIGYMLNAFLPARLGDFARAVLIGSIPPVTIATGLSTTVVDRLIDMVFVVAVLPFTLATVVALPDWMETGARATGIVAIAGIVVLIIAANQRPFVERVATAVLNRIPFMNTASWVRRVDDLLKGLDALSSPKDSLILILLTLLVWLPIIFAYYIGMTAVGLDVTWVMAVFVFAAAALSVALPSSPGQIGVYHAGVIAALTLLGQPEAGAASFAFSYHALNMILIPIILGVIGLAATGSTIKTVVHNTQAFMKRNKTVDSPASRN